jgi:hypothetical protein
MTAGGSSALHTPGLSPGLDQSRFRSAACTKPGGSLDPPADRRPGKGDTADASRPLACNAGRAHHWEEQGYENCDDR